MEKIYAAGVGSVCTAILLREALRPKRIWDQIHFAYVKGSRELKKWEQQGNDIMTQDGQYLLDFMTTKCRKLWDPSPLWMQSCGERNPDQVFMILQIGTRGMGVVFYAV